MTRNIKRNSVALDSGYESFSRIHAAFKNDAGLTPSQANSQPLITKTQLTIPLRPMYVGASEKGLCFLEFTDRKRSDHQIAQLQQRMKARYVPGKTSILAQLESQLAEYFDASRREFQLPSI